MSTVVGKKDSRDLFDNLIGSHIPDDIQVYVEPFGGTFCLNKFFKKQPEFKVYNDIQVYDFAIDADLILHTDYKEVIREWDKPGTFFYLDPPYYGKERYYGLMNNDKQFHIELKSIIDTISSPFIISYERCSFIEKLYSNYNIYAYRGTNKFLKNEIIIKR